MKANAVTELAIPDLDEFIARVTHGAYAQVATDINNLLCRLKLPMPSIADGRNHRVIQSKSK